MDIILVPGLWLDGSSWEEVAPVLERAGHRAHPLTLPGMESKADLTDLDDEGRRAFRQRAVPRPEELGRAIVASVGPS